jgi:hypothetical protein
MTAVEWLFDNLNKCFDKLDNGEYAYIDFVNASKEVREQAKKMEKQQIIDSHIQGHNAPSSTIKIHDAEQYYNETFKI